MLRTFAALILAGGVAATAPAASAAPAAYWGGGGVPDRMAKGDLAAFLGSWGVGLRRSEDGRRIAVRVSFAIKKCGRHRSTATDALVAADLAPDGTFHLKGAPARTDEMGKVAVTIDGTAVAGRADGTLSVRTAWGCGLSARAFTARQIDPAVPATGAPAAPADGLLYGITFQDLKQAPHPFVVKVDAGATVAHGFVSWTQRCKGRDRKGPYRSTWGYQTILPEQPLAAGAWTVAKTEHETKAERRKGARLRNTFAVKAAFDGVALRGTLENTYSYRDRKASVKCSSGGPQGFAVTPA